MPSCTLEASLSDARSGSWPVDCAGSRADLLQIAHAASLSRWGLMYTAAAGRESIRGQRAPPPLVYHHAHTSVKNEPPLQTHATRPAQPIVHDHVHLLASGGAIRPACTRRRGASAPRQEGAVCSVEARKGLQQRSGVHRCASAARSRLAVLHRPAGASFSGQLRRVVCEMVCTRAVAVAAAAAQRQPSCFHVGYTHAGGAVQPSSTC